MPSWRRPAPIRPAARDSGIRDPVRGGMARLTVSELCCGAGLERNIGTKMTASAINTTAPSRRCFSDRSIEWRPEESAPIIPATMPAAFAVTVSNRSETALVGQPNRRRGDEERAERDDAIARRAPQMRPRALIRRCRARQRCRFRGAPTARDRRVRTRRGRAAISPARPAAATHRQIKQRLDDAANVLVRQRAEHRKRASPRRRASSTSARACVLPADCARHRQ